MSSKVIQADDSDRHGWKLLLLIPGLIISSTATILLLCSDQAPWTNSGRLYRFVHENRATTQIIVQVIAQILGALNVYTVCSLVAFATRLRLAKSPLTLDALSFWSALCLQHVDWSLPLGLLIPLVLLRISFFIPAALWTGALTPTQVNAHLSHVHSLNVTQYSNDSRHLWGDLTWTKQMDVVRTRSEVFTYSPNYDLIGVILNQAASPSNSPHVKLDNTGYSYAGRSYGVGSSVGLVDQGLSSNTTFSYAYSEVGYLTDVSCILNASSAWALTGPIFRSDNPTYPNLYTASGRLANEYGEGDGPEGYAACGLGNSDQILALAGNSTRGNNSFSIAAGGGYAAFDKVQCSVDFKPARFSVTVRRTDSMINVSPSVSTQDAPPEDMEPDGIISGITMRMPTSFSQQHACDLYTSLIGNTFTQNVQSTSADKFDPSNKDASLTEKVLRGVEDGLTSMLDNSLLAFSSAQLMIAKDTKPVSAYVTVSAARIGKGAYIYATAAINFAILLLCFVELLRTGNWKGLSSFDYTNIKSVTVGASNGGFQVAQEARKLHERKTSESGNIDGELGKIKVQLEGKGEDVKIVGVIGGNKELPGARSIWRRKKVPRRDTEMESLTLKHDPMD